MDFTFAEQDKSPNLDDPGQEAAGYRGRFEAGDLLVGAPGVLTANLYGNGVRRLQLRTGERFDLPFTITKNGQQLTSGQVERMEPAIDTTRFNLRIDTGTLSADCVGATLTVYGEQGVISFVAPATSGVNVEKIMKLPFQLRDDDGMFVPQDPDVSTLPLALGKAFVVPKFDTAGVATFNSNSSPFRLNLSMIHVSSASSQRNAGYWLRGDCLRVAC